MDFNKKTFIIIKHIMKNLLHIFIFTLGVAFALCSCDNNEFTEEDALKSLQQISLQISVIDAANDNVPVEGAQVKIGSIGENTIATTNEFGIASFNKIPISGNILMSVAKADFTTITTSINTLPNNYRQNVISSVIQTYALTGENIVTVKGQLTLEKDLTNFDREVIADAEVVVKNNNLESTPKYFSTKSDENGFYEIKIPVASNNSDQLEVIFPKQIEVNRTAAENNNNIHSIETRMATYSPFSYNASSIAQVPSAIITIASPISGDQATAYIDSYYGLNNYGGIRSINIGNYGSGYDSNNPPIVTVTALLGYGEGAELTANVDHWGNINSVNITNPGKDYRSNINSYIGDNYNHGKEGYITNNTHSNNNSYTNRTTILDVAPASTIKIDAYFGTGRIIGY